MEEKNIQRLEKLLQYKNQLCPRPFIHDADLQLRIPSKSLKDLEQMMSTADASFQVWKKDKQTLITRQNKHLSNK